MLFPKWFKPIPSALWKSSSFKYDYMYIFSPTMLRMYDVKDAVSLNSQCLQYSMRLALLSISSYDLCSIFITVCLSKDALLLDTCSSPSEFLPDTKVSRNMFWNKYNVTQHVPTKVQQYVLFRKTCKGGPMTFPTFSSCRLVANGYCDYLWCGLPGLLRVYQSFILKGRGAM